MHLSVLRGEYYCDFPPKNYQLHKDKDKEGILKLVWREYYPGGALGYILGGYVPPETPNWHPVLKKMP